MFQDFTASTNPNDGPPRVARLRTVMAAQGVDAFLVPRADAHQGEYVAPHDDRLAWLTGFTGSAGFCVVTAETAALFVDGRYTLQVREQSDPATFEQRAIPGDHLSNFLIKALPEGGTVGFDPWLHGRKQIRDLKDALNGHKITLSPVDNLVDKVWDDQPDPPMGRVSVYPPVYAGETHAEKRARVGEIIKEQGAAAAVLSLPDSVAWLLNIRGADISHTPVPHAFALVHSDGAVQLFIASNKLDDAVRTHLGADVKTHEPQDLAGELAIVDGPILLDETSAPLWIANQLEAANVDIIWGKDPCILPKACKNATELEGARTAHVRDGAAMAEFLCWLDDHAPTGDLTEIDVVKALEARRRATNALQDISFDTISGAGSNGAIVHYRVTEDTNRPVRLGELLLVDSGGQYLDGTTDVTRTIAVGAADPTAIRAFTLVLKGMIAISLARWPEGLAGRDLDALARNTLWQAGLDYDHGTGHGVGHFLGVHEGPQSLSRRGTAPFKPGMIVSNEPGYYKEGAFGIRIENLVYVTQPDIPEGGDRTMLGMQTLTLVPIDRRLIDPSLLTTAERGWLNTYHARVIEEVAPLVSPGTQTWLAEACAPI